MTNLTELEKTVLSVSREVGEESCGVSSAEDMIDQNMSWTELIDFTERTSLSVEVIKGVLGSLEKKGLIETGHKNPETGAPQQVLTDKGIEAAYEAAKAASDLGAAVDEILSPGEAAIFMERLEAGSDPYEGMTPADAAILEAKIESKIRARNPKTLKLSGEMVEVDLDHPVGSNPEEVSE